MPINIDQIKNRLNALQKSTKTSNATWKPSAKETIIRIVPYKFDPDNPFIELYFHYGVAGKSYLSPQSFGNPDPIVEASNKLKAAGDKESWKLGKKLEPKLRTFAPVVVRDKEHEGVKFWGFGKTVYEELLGYISDPDYGDITDPVTGRDLVVHTVQNEGQDFPITKVRIKPNQTAITDDRKILETIFESQINITDVYEEKTYEELEAALYTHLNPEAANNQQQTAAPAPAAESATDTPQAESATPPKEEAPAQPESTENIAEAFDKIFKKQAQ